MGVLRQPHRRLYAAFLLLFFATALGSGLVGMVEEGEAMGQEQWEGVVRARRRLAGPGSSPPTCRGRCGRCFPCHPIHVAIQPDHIMPLEYYPEAWRCKCGDKLFMP